MPKAKAAAEKALGIDNSLGEAHVSPGYVGFTYDFEWNAAGKHFDQALALNPAYARTRSFYPLYLSSRPFVGIDRGGIEGPGTRPRFAREQPQFSQCSGISRVDTIRPSSSAAKLLISIRPSPCLIPSSGNRIPRKGWTAKDCRPTKNIWSRVAGARCRSLFLGSPTPAPASAAKHSRRSSSLGSIQAEAYAGRGD
jgi:hypothetical protein